MGVGQSLTRPFQKVVPATRGYIQPIITGIGFDAVLKFADGFIGSPLQQFGMNVPVVGRISLIDFINFIVHNKGFHFTKKDGYLALIGAKGIQTGFNLRPILNLGATVSTQSTSPNLTSGAQL